MRQEPRHPRLTALRALNLLCDVTRAKHASVVVVKDQVLDDVARQLEEHIKADLVRRRKR